MKSIMEFSHVLRDQKKLKKFIITNQGSIKAWGVFLIVTFALYHLFSDGDFSFLMTLSSLISMFSFLMVAYKIESTNSCAGVSLKMIECYVILLFARLCSIIPYQGYLPYDRSGDWLYQTIEAISFCLSGSIVYMCRIRYKNTYNASEDSLNHFYFLIPSLLLALIFHPSLNAVMPIDVAWTFALYLESVCVLPQLFMFQKQDKVEPSTTHFLAGQALSKVLLFFFWTATYSELNGPADSIKSYVGIWVIVMQIIQLIVMGDFIFLYIRCLSRGVPVEFILTENV